MLKLCIVDTDSLRDPDLFSTALSNISSARREKAKSYRLTKDCRLSLGGGIALDQVLQTVGLREQTAQVSLGPKGKPYLIGREGLHFNLSHSGHFAVCALSDVPVGVDVETGRRVTEPLIRKALTPREKAILSEAPPEEQNTLFWRFWTAKESFMKYRGEGLGLPLKSMELAFTPQISMVFRGEPCNAHFHQWPMEGGWLTLCSASGVEPEMISLLENDLKMRYSCL